MFSDGISTRRFFVCMEAESGVQRVMQVGQGPAGERSPQGLPSSASTGKPVMDNNGGVWTSLSI